MEVCRAVGFEDLEEIQQRSNKKGSSHTFTQGPGARYGGIKSHEMAAKAANPVTHFAPAVGVWVKPLVNRVQARS